MNAPCEPVIPWIIPALSPELKGVIFSLGHQIDYKKNEVVLHENEKMDSLLYIEQGLLAQAVINPHLSKPLAMNLFTPGRVVGCLNLFTHNHAPRKVLSLQNSHLIRVPHHLFLEALEQNFDLYKKMVQYCEAANLSELSGMVALFTMSAEDRLKLLFTVALTSSSYFFEAHRDEWVRLPFTLKRTDILRVIYTSQITLDRLLSQWSKKHHIKRERKAIYVKTGNLFPIYQWMRAQ